MGDAANVLGHEAKKKVIEKILASPLFQRRESSKRILSYLLDQHLAGTDADIKEYTLAIEVFGKASDYDPTTDASVRVAVGKLRDQLEHYSLTEGAGDEIAVSLPRRQYQLKFESAVIPSAVPEIRVEPPRSSRPVVTYLSLGAAAFMLLLIGAGIEWFLKILPEANDAKSHSTVMEGPLFREFWQPLENRTRPTLVSLGTPLFVRYDGHRMRASSVEDFAEAQQYQPMLVMKEVLKSGRFQESRNYTGVGEANSAFLIGNLLARRGLDPKLVRNNALTWEEIAVSNVIFLGPPKFNPHIDRVPAVYNFAVTGEGIENRGPLSGEQALYKRVDDEGPIGQTSEDHLIISRLPGLYGRGFVYVFASSATYGTWAAGVCATQPSILEPILGHVAANGKDLPTYFEIVVRARFENNVPLSMEYVSHREVVPGAERLHPPVAAAKVMTPGAEVDIAETQ